jgi:predicted glycosyltransferase
MKAGAKLSVLFWVQHLLGIGHLQRSLRIADALVERGIAVTIVSGGMPQSLPRDPAVALVQLPPLRARDASFALIDEAGEPIDDALRERRRDALLAIFAAVRPDAVVLEGFPFARRAFRFELDALIKAARTAPWRSRECSEGRLREHPPILCSVRDIVVVRDDPRRHREIVGRVRRDIDRVLVHGDPALIPFEASFPPTSDIADRLVYTGYVAPRRVEGGAGTANGEGAGGVIVSAGGGGAGKALLEAALAVRQAGCLANLRWRVIAGANLPESDFATLRASAPAGVAVERFRNDFAALLRACRVSVSQAGYNTVLDLLAARARAVLVPFAAERETEQLLRAELLAAIKGATTSIHMTMYLLTSTEITNALVAAKKKGLEVKAVLNQTFPSGGGSNATPFATLKNGGVDVVYAPAAYTYTHEKCFILDGKEAWIMTMNATVTSSTANREYLAVDHDPGDIQEAEQIFQADFANKAITPIGNLLVAPVNAQGKLVALIGTATKTIDLEGEEFSDSKIVDALVQRAKSGVKVRVVVASGSSSTSLAHAIATVKACGVAVVAQSNPYIHAKALVVDGARAYVGSENFSTGSLVYNRELGLIVDTSSEVAKVAAAIATDFSTGTAQ